MPHRLRKLPRIWAPEASLPGSYTRFIDFLTPFLPILVIKRPLNRPFPLPAHRIFTDFCSRFVKGISGAPRGGIMSLEGVKFSKRFKLPTDLQYSIIPMRCGVRVVTKIHHCGGTARAYSRAIPDFRFFDPIFRLWATFTRPFWSQHILVLKYAAPRPQAAARTLQLVFLYNLYGKPICLLQFPPNSHILHTFQWFLI